MERFVKKGTAVVHPHDTEEQHCFKVIFFSLLLCELSSQTGLLSEAQN